MFGWFKKKSKTTYECERCRREQQIPEVYYTKWFTCTQCPTCGKMNLLENKKHENCAKMLDDAYKAWDNVNVGGHEDITTVPTIISLL